ncbi:MAG: hypothetical protein GTO40_13175 [Deltaproteobacteria bacterium]|nr:hypothetical protein [Deltaproteobacteria bacterium]
MANTNFWPSMVDYQEAVQSPGSAFASSELCSGTPVTNKLGMPRPICGTFASVYEFITAGRRRWAVKCFLRNIPDLHQRYAKISDHLKKNRWLPYFATFEYQENGIKVRGKSFPLVKMEWLDGDPLNTFIEKNLSRPKVLTKLHHAWEKLLADLRSAKIAHGDLQHGNVLVRPNGDLRLIDYDGMWVPSLEGQVSNETGHPDYQSPRRTQKHFHEGIDKFSNAVIQLSICALAENPGLWKKYNNGDNLLFRRRDFLNLRKSSLIADLQKLKSPNVKNMLAAIVKECHRGRKVKSGNPANKPKAVPASWLTDYVQDYRPKPKPHSSPKSPSSNGETNATSSTSSRRDGVFSSIIRAIFGS